MDSANKTKEKYAEGYLGGNQGKKLTIAQLASLERICKEFRKSLDDTCDNLALYRCNLTCDGRYIYAVMSGSNENGKPREGILAYELTTGNVETTELVIDEKKVGKDLYNLVVGLLKVVPLSVGMLSIPVNGKFTEGTMFPYNKERGTILIVIEDSLPINIFTD